MMRCKVIVARNFTLQFRETFCAEKTVRRQRCLGLGVRRGRKQADFGVTGIKPRVLNDDRNVGFENGGIICVARDGRGLFEIVETQMQRAPGGDRDPIDSDRLTIGEEYGYVDVRFLIAGIEDAGGSRERSVRDRKANSARECILRRWPSACVR